MNKRLLIVTDGLYPVQIGGMQKHAFYLIRSLLEKAYQIDVVLPKNDEYRSHEFASNNLVNFHLLDRPTYRFPLHYLFEERSFSRSCYAHLSQLDLNEFDAIITKGFTTSEWKKTDGLPKIFSQIHGLEMFQPSLSFGQRIKNLFLQKIAIDSLRNADVVLSYGGKIMDLHRRLLGKKADIRLFTGGIPVEKLKRQITFSSNPRRFLFIGRDERRKGIPELIKILNESKREIELSWIGESPHLESLTNPKFKLTKHGVISDAASYFDIIDNSDILLVPSISEGLPTVILEAMARGLCCISMDVGAIAGVVNNENGWLVSSHQEFATALDQALDISQDDLMSKKQKSLEKISSEYTWSQLISRLEGYIYGE